MKCICPGLGTGPKGPGGHCASCGCVNNPSGQGHKSDGTPCGQTVYQGTHRCLIHGGKTPAAEYKAREAMALLRMPAIEALYGVMQVLMKTVDRYDENTCPTCGYPKGDIEEIEALCRACAVIVKDAQTVLDRTGIHAKATLEVKQSDGDLDLAALTDGERTRIIGLLNELRELKESIRARVHGTVPTQTIM